jgi:hypothetical protein
LAHAVRDVEDIRENLSPPLVREVWGGSEVYGYNVIPHNRHCRFGHESKSRIISGIFILNVLERVGNTVVGELGLNAEQEFESKKKRICE